MFLFSRTPQPCFFFINWRSLSTLYASDSCLRMETIRLKPFHDYRETRRHKRNVSGFYRFLVKKNKYNFYKAISIRVKKELMGLLAFWSMVVYAIWFLSVLWILSPETLIDALLIDCIFALIVYCLSDIPIETRCIYYNKILNDIVFPPQLVKYNQPLFFKFIIGLVYDSTSESTIILYVLYLNEMESTRNLEIADDDGISRCRKGINWN